MQLNCLNSGGYFVDLYNKKFERKDFYDEMHMNYQGVDKVSNYLYNEFASQGIIKNLKNN